MVLIFGKFSVNAAKGSIDTPWGKHWTSQHKGREVQMNDIRILATESDIINRKIREAIEIRKKGPTINISKGYVIK